MNTGARWATLLKASLRVGRITHASFGVAILRYRASSASGRLLEKLVEAQEDAKKGRAVDQPGCSQEKFEMPAYLGPEHQLGGR
jgi:hypothetical protein